MPFTTTVPTGSVGVVYNFGKLSSEPLKPGTSFKAPWPISRVALVDIRPQSDEVKDIECSSKDNLRLRWPLVRVFNQLDHDNVISVIHDWGEDYDVLLVRQQVETMLTEACTSMTANELYNTKFDTINDMIKEHLANIQKQKNTGLRITDVYVAKPVLPHDVMANFEKVVVEKTALEAETHKQNRQIKEKETETKLKELDAEQQRKVAEVTNRQNIESEKATAEIKKIEAESKAQTIQIDATANAEAKRIDSEAEALAIRTIAEANVHKFTPEYLEMIRNEALLKNTKI
jgi:regulator of protease activity HflC (stomatin/prohibitin superfamily)